MSADCDHGSTPAEPIPADDAAGDLARFARTPPSRIGSHRASCCWAARRAVRAALDAPDVGSRLALIPERFAWGPMHWPVTWCALEGPAGLRGDCGVHADLGSMVLSDESIDHRRATIAIDPIPGHRDHWTRTWAHEPGANVNWIGRRLVYHEVLATSSGLWDPSEARWFAGVGGQLDCGTVVAFKLDRGPWQR